MSIFKNINFKQDKWTTIVGILSVCIIPLLGFFGLLTPEQQEAAKTSVQQIYDAIAANSWTTLFTTVFGFVMLFIKDPKKK